MIILEYGDMEKIIRKYEYVKILVKGMFYKR